MSDWHLETKIDLPECLVLNEDTRTVVSEFDSTMNAYAWIADTQDHQERIGLSPSNYRVIPVRVSPGGKDIR